MKTGQMKTETGIFTKESIVLHIPHSSCFILPEYRNLFYLNEEELEEEQLKMTDRYVDELFDLPFPKIVFPVSRLLCDVERFREDAREVMAARGMGVCYTGTSGLQPLKKNTGRYRRAMLKLYDRHHRQFEDLAEERLKAAGSCLIIDCHSFSSVRLPYEEPSEELRPDICIGVNRGSHRVDTAYFRRAFEKRGFSVRINTPFSGAIVPAKFYERDCRIGSVMIEINRSLYMNEKNGEKLPSFEKLKTEIREIVCKMPDIPAAQHSVSYVPSER